MYPLSFIVNIGALQAVILFSGLILIVIEMFNPGFGAPGIMGLFLLMVGVLLTARSLFDALIMVIIILAILGLAFIFALRSAKKGRLNRILVLSDSLKNDLGYNSSRNLDHLMGKEGTVLTILRPSGSADIDGIILDVVSEGSFIAKGSKVEVVEVTGNRVVVRPK